jgi:DNA-binding IclR family transcriptional regulator
MKTTWITATVAALRRFCERHRTREVTLQGLLREEAPRIFAEAGTQGRTPEATLRYTLQQLAKRGFLEFTDGRGTYRVLA